MCRITGFISPTFNQSDLTRMRDSMHRGGPDDAGIYHDPRPSAQHYLPKLRRLHELRLYRLPLVHGDPCRNASSAPDTGHEAPGSGSAVRRRPATGSRPGSEAIGRTGPGPPTAAAASGLSSGAGPTCWPRGAGWRKPVGYSGPTPFSVPPGPAGATRRWPSGDPGVARPSLRNDLTCHRSLSRITRPFGPTHSSAVTHRADATSGTRVAVTPRGTR